MAAGGDERDDSFWPQVAGDWSQFRTRVQERWGHLTDEDLDYMGGDRERTLGRLRERHQDGGWNENDIERELAGLRNL